MVQTPVGARCPTCARLYKLPIYRVSLQYYLRAIAAGLGAAIIAGIIWGLIDSLIPFFILSLLLAPAAGYAIGEAVGRATNRKRGQGLATIAGTALVISYFVSSFFSLPFGFHLSLFRIFVSFHILDLLALALGIFVAVNRLR
jgi:hypothetical protein